MNRKEFVKTCTFACIGGSVLGILFEACASSSYLAQSTIVNNKIVLKRSEFITQSQGKETVRNFVLIKNSKYQFPICIYTLGKDSYSALLMECTHKGCELQANKEFLVCPCHGSEFSKEGQVQSPPADKNLKSFIITTDNENIYIQI